MRNLNRPVYIREIESIVNNLLKQKVPGPNGFIGEFYQTKGEVTPILHNLFQKAEAEGIHANLFYEASITLTPKSDKDILRKL